ncbi:aldo/keto reductase [Acinetobacter qingfengensis]|uniref:Aldo/keto reductase n=1 Tax=Acinetobacter qingfengensis TaxID=1262585 RepID=A0A1E7R199_9GAMM|nr:aldo/keto reductase [Acinetobacter qingfengensis]KAA8733276.1 aldo/keto reductase [Acinetobacter qingfengensis]OEY93092.1 aldo/keto reductase [Acinetobacter qingfengensis]
MKTRILGQNLEVSAMGFGCMGMSFAYGGLDQQHAIRIIHQALDHGINFFDSAEVYGPFENEKLIARAIQGRNENIRIATKFGFKIDQTKQGVEQICGVDSRPTHIREVVEASLRRLGVEKIDLLYQHRVDPNVPIEDVVGTMADLIKEGKVLHLGLCEISAQTLRKAHAIHPITAVQSEYSLWTRQPEQQILPVCKELNIGFVPYSPLGRGFLTGHLDTTQLSDTDFRTSLPRFQQQAVQHNQQLLAQCQDIAANNQCSLAQLALAWMLNKHSHLVPIPGIRKAEHLMDNIAAVDVSLSTTDIAQLDEIFQEKHVYGQRYNQQDLDLIDA